MRRDRGPEFRPSTVPRRADFQSAEAEGAGDPDYDAPAARSELPVT